MTYRTYNAPTLTSGVSVDDLMKQTKVSWSMAGEEKRKINIGFFAHFAMDIYSSDKPNGTSVNEEVWLGTTFDYVRHLHSIIQLQRRRGRRVHALKECRILALKGRLTDSLKSLHSY